jgi:hypothetical protein
MNNLEKEFMAYLKNKNNVVDGKLPIFENNEQEDEEYYEDSGNIEDEELQEELSEEEIPEVINCPCGSAIKKTSYNKHLESLKHIRGLNKINGLQKFKKSDLKKSKAKKKVTINPEVEIIPDQKINVEYIPKEEIKQEIKPKFNNKVTIVNDKKIEPEAKKEVKKKRQLRHSNFFETFNTNQRFTEYNEGYQAYVDKLKAVLKDMFNNYMDRIIKMVDNGDIEKDIKDVTTEFCVEKAPNTDTIHAHALITVDHYAKVHLDYKFMCEFIKQSMGLSNIYHQSKLFKDANNKTTLKEYIEKSLK